METGRSSWTAVLDAVRLQLGADSTAMTTVQIREVIGRLIAAGRWREDDPDILVVLDAGYDAPRIGHLLADSRRQLRTAIASWIERTYHRRRRQARLGRFTPVEFETIMSPAAGLAT